MSRLLTLLVLLALSHLTYAGNFGVSPASNSPTEHHSDKKAKNTKKDKKKGALSLFKHKKKVHRLKREAGVSKRKTLGPFLDNLLDWYYDIPWFWMALVLISVGLIITGIMLGSLILLIIGIIAYVVVPFVVEYIDNTFLFLLSSIIIILFLGVVMKIAWLIILGYTLIGLVILLCLLLAILALTLGE